MIANINKTVYYSVEAVTMLFFDKYLNLFSGRIDSKFLPMGKILKPVLNERVTPVTCYWSLALLLHDEDQLTLVFQVISW
jgi:GPI-GlcNAc transferase complex, PIG-H component